MKRLPRGAGVVFRAFGRADLLARGPALRGLARSRGLVFLVGGDPRLARALGADGLHLPERRLPARVVRNIWPRGFIITAAVHSYTALRRAGLAGVDAVVASPVFPSASPSAARPLGPMRVATWVRKVDCPIYALGGVNKETARRLIATSVRGVAAIDGLARRSRT